MLRSVFCILTVWALSTPLGFGKPAPVEDFFKNPDFQGYQISPDGTHLVVLVPVGGYMNLVSIDLATKQPKVLTGERHDISNFYFVNDTRIFYRMDAGVATSHAIEGSGGISAVNLDGSDLRAIVRPRRDRAGMIESLGKGSKIKGDVVVVDTYERDPEHVLIRNNGRRAKYPDILLMSVKDGSTQRVMNNPGRISNFFFDSDGNVRGGVESDPEGKGDIIVRLHDPETGQWSVMQKGENFELEWEPVGITAGDHRLMVTSRHASDRKELYWLDLKTGSFSDEPIYADPVYDVDATPLLGFIHHDIVGVAYQAEKPRYVYFNDQYKKLQAILDQTFPTTINRVVSVDDRATKGVVRTYSDVQTPKYYLLNLKTMEMEALANPRPWLDSVDLRPVKPITYTARDGRTIHGYLTLPAPYKPGHPVPLILHPHGGPWARDTWGSRNWIDLMVQFMANRGFAVLQMNFRGSTGYGKDHYRSSFKHIDQMHYDVIDGANWAIEQGYADPDRLGIAGASWGGYATMTALVKEPDMFQFGVDIFGVVDLIEHINTYRQWEGRDSGYYYWIERIGDPRIKEDRAMLKDWSALTHIDDLKAPLFIYHGLVDANVDIEQSRMLIRALKRKGWKEGREYTKVFRKNEAHSAQDEKDRIAFYSAIDEFLKPFAPAWQEN